MRPNPTSYLEASCLSEAVKDRKSLVIRQGRTTTQWVLSDRNEPDAVDFHSHELCLAYEDAGGCSAIHLTGFPDRSSPRREVSYMLSLYGVKPTGERECLYDFNLDTEGLQGAVFALFGIALGGSSTTIISPDGQRSVVSRETMSNSLGNLPLLCGVDAKPDQLWAPLMFLQIEAGDLRHRAEELCEKLADECPEMSSWRMGRVWELCQVAAGAVFGTALNQHSAANVDWFAGRTPMANYTLLRIHPNMVLPEVLVDLACNERHLRHLPFAGGVAQQVAAAITCLVLALNGHHQIEMQSGVPQQ